MGALTLEPGHTPPSEDAAVFVMEGDVAAHVGILYRTGNDGPHRHLHLAWHFRLQDDDAPPGDVHWVKPRLHEDEIDALRIATSRVARRHADGRIPYALNPRDARFDEEGRLHLNRSLGLTCSSFVLLVFERAKIPLLERSTWDTGLSAERQREDAGAQQRLVDALQRNPDARAHAVLVKREVGCTRIRPEEVAAASGMTGRPVSFSRAEMGGREVLTRMRNSTWTGER